MLAGRRETCIQDSATDIFTDCVSTKDMGVPNWLGKLLVLTNMLLQKLM